eukprot:4195914-Prymnesium_polylepis.1
MCYTFHGPGCPRPAADPASQSGDGGDCRECERSGRLWTNLLLGDVCIVVMLKMLNVGGDMVILKSSRQPCKSGMTDDHLSSQNLYLRRAQDAQDERLGPHRGHTH